MMQGRVRLCRDAAESVANAHAWGDGEAVRYEPMRFEPAAPVRTQQQVAAILGITRGGVQMAESKALQKMRAAWMGGIPS